MAQSSMRRVRYPELEEHYELYETLGSGGFAKVKAGIHKLTGEKVAVKIMDKEQLGADLPRVYREIRALQKLHHQHICQLYQIIETDRMIHLILEFCPGGELFDYIVARERLKEKEARSFFRQILSAICYVHENGFIHRDLKPENLLLDEESNIKLIDFGLVSEPEDTHDLLQTCCGSPAYAAPELIRGGPYIGTSADVWSLGVLLYALLNGFLPFDDDHTPRLYQLIQKGEYEIPEWLSLESISVLARLLQVNPDKRSSVNRLLGDHWVMRTYHKPVDWHSRIEMDKLDKDCVGELARYHMISDAQMTDEILEWRYDNVTAAYFLLLQQKHQGRHPKIILAPRPQVASAVSATVSLPSPLLRATSILSNGTLSTSSIEFHLGQEDSVSPDVEPVAERSVTGTPTIQFGGLADSPLAMRRRISVGQPIHPPTGELLSLQKPLLPAISNIKDDDLELLDPLYKTREASGSPQLPTSNTMTFDIPPSKMPVKKTRSYDSRLQHAVDDQSRHTLSPQPLRRKRFGSVELGVIIRKAKRVFSSRRLSEASGPRRVKGMFDARTTSTKSSEEVIAELEIVLQKYNVTYEKKGFILHCSVPSYKESSGVQRNIKVKWIKFNLEVCLLTQLNMIIGVRRKRIKGDVWEYKRICDQIFAATHL